MGKPIPLILNLFLILLMVNLLSCGLFNSPLIQSESNKVCMVTDKYMGSEQIPVSVEGKAYYGCCAGCASKLKENQNNVRFSKDPLTGEEVDKATAYIVHITDGSNNVFYFKSKKTYQQYVDNFHGLPMPLRALK